MEKYCPEHKTKLNRAGNCGKCQERECNRRYQAKHKQELKDKRKVYLEKNHDHILEYQRNYTKTHQKDKFCPCGEPKGYKKRLCDECRKNHNRTKFNKWYENRSEEQKLKRNKYMREYLKRKHEIKNIIKK